MAAVAPRKSDTGHGTYTFSSQPRTVPQRKKYRDMAPPDEPIPYGNIMYDRRIVRGNTYAQHTLPASAQPDPIEIQRQQEARRRAAARRRARQQLKPRSPDPVEGRKHIDVQTELYLEELSDRVEEAEAETQTDAFLDRPPTPLFVPAKTGIDVATQIEEGDLFDFDIEVKPILEVLVGKTMEQALLEVMEEEELAALRQRQREFEQIRHAELVETQRLEEQDRRHREEKQRRMAQERKRVMEEKETMEKIAARAFAQSYLEDLVPSVFNTLDMHGYFYDHVEREVETSFLPWLIEQVNGSLSQTETARAILDGIIRDVVKKRAKAYRGQGPDIWKDLEKEEKEARQNDLKEEVREQPAVEENVKEDFKADEGREGAKTNVEEEVKTEGRKEEKEVKTEEGKEEKEVKTEEGKEEKEVKTEELSEEKKDEDTKEEEVKGGAKSGDEQGEGKEKKEATNEEHEVKKEETQSAEEKSAEADAEAAKVEETNENEVAKEEAGVEEAKDEAEIEKDAGDAGKEAPLSPQPATTEEGDKNKTEIVEETGKGNAIEGEDGKEVDESA